MVTTELETEVSKELLELAEQRVGIIVHVAQSLDYQDDVDLLIVRLSDKPSIKSKYDYDNGVVFNFDKLGGVVSLEVQDIKGLFVSA